MTVYITRCPACQQAFKITENILQAKNGQVRCGFCQNVFNAREHLYKSSDLEGSLNEDPKALDELGRLYKNGIYVPKNKKRAFQLWNLSKKLIRNRKCHR